LNTQRRRSRSPFADVFGLGESGHDVDHRAAHRCRSVRAQIQGYQRSASARPLRSAPSNTDLHARSSLDTIKVNASRVPRSFSTSAPPSRSSKGCCRYGCGAPVQTRVCTGKANRGQLGLTRDVLAVVLRGVGDRGSHLLPEASLRHRSIGSQGLMRPPVPGWVGALHQVLHGSA
jgi:hypothetical protein